jgi:hypothetical protein
MPIFHKIWSIDQSYNNTLYTWNLTLILSLKDLVDYARIKWKSKNKNQTSNPHNQLV